MNATATPRPTAGARLALPGATPPLRRREVPVLAPRPEPVQGGRALVPVLSRGREPEKVEPR